MLFRSQNVAGTPGASTSLGCETVTVTQPAGHLQTTRPGFGREVIRDGLG